MIEQSFGQTAPGLFWYAVKGRNGIKRSAGVLSCIGCFR